MFYRAEFAEILCNAITVRNAGLGKSIGQLKKDKKIGLNMNSEMQQFQRLPADQSQQKIGMNSKRAALQHELFLPSMLWLLFSA